MDAKVELWLKSNNESFFSRFLGAKVWYIFLCKTPLDFLWTTATTLRKQELPKNTTTVPFFSIKRDVKTNKMCFSQAVVASPWESKMHESIEWESVSFVSIYQRDNWEKKMQLLPPFFLQIKGNKINGRSICLVLFLPQRSFFVALSSTDRPLYNIYSFYNKKLKWVQ